MADKPIRVLYVDDYPLDRALVKDALAAQKNKIILDEAASEEEFRGLLSQKEFDIVLSDFNILGFTGLQVVEIVKEIDPNLPVIIVTGTGSEEIAAEAIKRGAADYVIKSPRHIQRLPLTIQTVLENNETKRQQEKNRLELIQSERRHRRLMDTLQEGIWGIDENARTTFVNPSMARMLGYNQEDMIGMSLFDFMDENGEKIALENLERRQEGIAELHDFEFITKSGKRILTSMNTSPLENEQGKYQGAVAAVRDITQIKEAEQALNEKHQQLQENEERYRLLVNQIGAALFLHDLDGNIIEVNQITVDRYGYTRQELLELNVHDIEPQLLPREGKDIFHKIFKTGHTIFETRHQINDGTEFPVEISVSPLTLQGNNYLIALASDISDRKAAEDSLKTSEEKFRASFENAPVPMAMVNREGKFLTVNEAAAAFLIYTTDELLGKSFTDVTLPEDRERTKNRFQQCIKDHKSYQVEKRYLTSTGKVVIGSTAVSPVFSTDGQFLFTVTQINDITREKESEQALNELKDFYHLILNNVKDGIWVTNKNERIIYFNPGMEQIAGVSGKDILGLSVLEDISPETTKDFLPFYLAAKKDQIAKYFRAAVTIPEGRDTIQAGWLIPRYEGGAYQGMICTIQDVTEKTRTAEALKQSEERFRSLFENMLDGFALHEMIYDDAGKPVDYRFLEVNPAFEYLTGLKKEQLLGNLVTETLPGAEEDDADWISIYGKVATSGEEIRVERYSEQLGKWFSVLAYSPAPGKFATLFRDITAKKEISQSLISSQERYQTLFESALDGLLIHQKGIIQDVNQTFLEMFGYSKEKVIGQPAQNLLPILDRPEVALQRIDQPVDEAQEYMVNLPDGSSLPVMVTAKDIHFQEEPSRLVSIRDITAEKEMEQAIRESEEKYRALYDNAPLSYQSLNDDGTIRDVNPAWERSLGYKKEEVIGTYFGSLLVPEHKILFEEKFPKFKEDGSASDVRYKIKHKSGRILDISIEGCVGYNPDGSFRQSYCVFADITEQVSAENKLTESEKNYRGLFQGALEGLVIHKEGIIKEVNQTFLDMFLCSREDVLETSITNLAAPESRTDARLRVIEPSDHLAEYKATRFDGTHFPILLKAKDVNYQDEDCRLVSMLDISQLKELELSVKESETRYRALVEASPDGIITAEPTGKVLSVNQSFLDLSGYQEEDFVGKNYTRIPTLLKQDLKFYSRIVENVLKGKVVEEIEFRWKHASGEVRDGEAKLSLAKTGTKNILQVIVRDITERKESQKALEQSEQSYRLLFDSLSDQVVIYDQNARIQMLNTTAYNNINPSGESPINKKLGEFLPAVHEDALESIHQVLDSKKPLTLQHSIQFPDGRLRWYATTMKPVFLPGNPEELVQSISTDITDRINYEETLRKSNIIINSTSDSVITTDLNGLITYWNPGAEKIYGYSPEEALGQPVSIIYPEENYTDLERIIRDLKQGAVPGTFEVTNLTKDQRKVQVLLTLSTIQDREGKIVELVGFTKDITPIRMAEQTLGLEKQRTQQYLDVAEIMLLALDQSGNVQTINPKGCEILGYSAEEILGKNWFDHYLAQDDIDKVKDVFQSTIQGDIEVIENFENSILRSDGTKRLIAFHNSVLQNEDGNIIGVFSSGEDITDRRQAELELLQSKETAERYLNIAAEIIVTLDREGKITQINTSGRELMGYQPGELIGKDWVKSSLPPADQPSFQKLYSSLMAGEVEGNESVQGKLVTRTGEVKDILWHNALLRDEDGSITGLLSSGEDITKLTKVLEELTQSQEQISRLNEAARKVHDLYERNKIFQTIGDEIANLGFDVAIFATSEDRAELEPVYFSYDDNLEHFSAKNILRHNQFKMSLTTDTYLKPIMQNQETVLATIGSRELKAMLPGIQKLAVKFLKEFLKTAIYAPLVVQGETTGLVVVSKVGLMEKDVPPIAAFAHQASAALRNARYAADLSQRAQELERLTALISEAEESERKRLAQELHDQVGQSLALLGFNLSQTKDTLGHYADIDLSRIEEAESILDDVSNGIRSVMDDLRPAILDDYGLLSALYWYTDKLSERTGLKTKIEENNFTIRLDPKVELALFRITQEALTNITRHAEATQAIVGFDQEEDKILMTITDDGVGFDPVRSGEVGTRQGWGLINMQERISRLGGSLEINAKPKKGTQLIFTVPRDV